MAYTKYLIQSPVQGTPISSSLFGERVRFAVSDLDDRVTQVENDQQAIIAWGRRTTAKVVAAASAGTEFGFLRIDNVPVKANKAYRIMTSGLNLDTDNQVAAGGAFTAIDTNTARIRVQYAAVTGTVATTSSPQIGSTRSYEINASQSDIKPLSCFYFASADGFISILLSAIRQAGSGSLQFFASSTETVDVTVEYAGPSPANTGVLL